MERRISSTSPMGADDQPSVFPGLSSESALVWRPVDCASGSSWFAFVGTGTEQNVDIFLGNLEGNRLIRLTQHPANDFQPAWSPDGSALAFVSGRNGSADIYLVTGLDRLVDRPASDSPAPTPVLLVGSAEDVLHPTWSPDGRYLAFTSHEIGPRETDLRVNAGISLIDLSRPDRGPIRLTHQAETAEFRPSFSPDQAAVAYYVHHDMVYADEQTEGTFSIGVSILEYSEDGNHILGARRLVGRTRHFASDVQLQGHSGPEWVPGPGMQLAYLRSSPQSGGLLCIASVPRWLDPGHSYEQSFALGTGLSTGMSLSERNRLVVAAAYGDEWGFLHGSIPDSLFGGDSAGLPRLVIPCPCHCPRHQRRWWRIPLLASGLGAAFLLGLAVP